jgi:hypothetical protein
MDVDESKEEVGLICGVELEKEYESVTSVTSLSPFVGADHNTCEPS